ncbi:Metallo-hydrolase/oxidoreductase [Neocallimastix lanati (nom. inval.)]|jgi:L-ascorbate metabolism protein UlaG (beta-lactamase superfamily)|uniref:Metallo-hydrolase/oxidoreductase n=1 Tax=Neocallimastix californiae TaxID=1754190 RepID=A0A1Y2CC67_9FUNG|nr:Metallo-hydrolase/oxidoreductase [Neocallimastix sp. JGI-2020a]ORY44633.1 Metallo-hydrolase/oxidoreductase [Neocallimastix californiae]|eukprot:ORY44633.1 Metallo-hydrolase/oxidoreductase [Neocallimastix californiae]
MYSVKKLPGRPKDINVCCPSVKVGNKYINPWPSSKNRSKSHFWETFFRVATRRSFKKLPEKDFVKVDVNLEAINSYIEKEKDIALQLIWFGHAAALLQINGFNILFDPLLTFRASPFKFIGHYRYRKRGFKSFSQLPQIDVLVISHNHYDHLDKRAIKEMFKEKKNKNLHIFCPIGLKKWFLKRFDLLNSQITEGDWWDDFKIVKNESDNSFKETMHYISKVDSSLSISSMFGNSSNAISIPFEIENEYEKKSLNVSFVPAQHSSRRTLFDGNKTLWGGWVIKSQYASFYFAGDTGYRAIPENCSNEERLKYPYCPVFTQIGNIHGPFDLACIPIGPSNDTNEVTKVHVDPTDAINIHKDIKSKRSIPIHWGTVANFCTIEVTHDPKVLRREMEKSGLPLEEFNIAYIGQVIKILKSETIISKEHQFYQIHEE